MSSGPVVPSSSPSYKIVAQTPQLVPVPGGSYVQGMRITAQLPNGASFYLDVPQDQYNVDTVRAMLQDKAKTVATIHNLTS